MICGRNETFLTVIMPVFNERFTLAESVSRVLRQEGQPGVRKLQLIVVDDGSTDGSTEILRGLAAANQRVHPIFHETNLGKTAAIRSGIDLAEGDITLIQDADLEYNPQEYSRLLRPFFESNADVVFGSRFLVKDYRRVLYFWHSLLNWCLTNLSNILLDLTLTDMETCYKVFRTPVLKSIPIRSTGFGFEPELTAKVAKRGLRLFEVPISYSGRTYGEGKKITWVDGLWAIYYILKFWLIDDCYKDLDKQILYTLSQAPRFNRWMGDVVRPFLGDRVLEIGSGIGNLTCQFLPRHRYIASDIDAGHLETLRSRFGAERGVEVERLDLQDAEGFRRFGNTLDSVVCLNVLEHVEDDVAALANLCGVLVPGGCVVLLVPQGRRLLGSLDRVVGHFRRYDRAEIRTKAERAGLVAERLIDFNRPGVLGWFVNGRLFQRTQLGKLQMKLYEQLVPLFRRIDGFLPWCGLSLVAVLRKPARTGLGEIKEAKDLKDPKDTKDTR